MKVDSRAGETLDHSALVNVPKLITAYYSELPDWSSAAEQVSFGTSGHRGSPFARTFNELHLLAIAQAVCNYRKQQQIDGPLFLGMDTHALSVPAITTVLEVLAANDVDVMLSVGDEYTPTPAVSLAILNHNQHRNSHRADGIVITPSHNPPHDGGIKYNPPHGGPAESTITRRIQAIANGLLRSGLKGVARVPYRTALAASTTHRYDYINTYVDALASVVDMAVIAESGLRLGVDPLGGAGVHYWSRIAERYRIDLAIVDQTVDPAFAFVAADWDGQIRMDPSSVYAMQRLIGVKEAFDVAFACDTDHDRHGIVTPSAGLIPPNHYLSVAVRYLFTHRPLWSAAAAVGKTIVSSQMINRIAADLGREVYEVPVGFKWFAQGLHNGSLGIAGEESAGTSFQRFDGSVWTTDKDGIAAALLAAEITARMGRDPSLLYQDLTAQFGELYFERKEVAAVAEQRLLLAQMTADDVHTSELAGNPIRHVASCAAGNGEAIGGLAVQTDDGWFAARPSGTEDLYKIYAESFKSSEHLNAIVNAAQEIVDEALDSQQVNNQKVSQ